MTRREAERSDGGSAGFGDKSVTCFFFNADLTTTAIATAIEILTAPLPSSLELTCPWMSSQGTPAHLDSYQYIARKVDDVQDTQSDGPICCRYVSPPAAPALFRMPYLTSLSRKRTDAIEYQCSSPTAIVSPWIRISSERTMRKGEVGLAGFHMSCSARVRITHA